MYSSRRWSAKAEPSVVGRLRHALVDFAVTHGIGPEGAANLRLCVTEAISNVVVHAFRDRVQPGTVDVTADVHDGELIIHVTDDGIGFVPRADSPGAGFGVPLMVRLADSMRITSREPGGTDVRLSFELGADDVRADRALRPDRMAAAPPAAERVGQNA